MAAGLAARRIPSTPFPPRTWAALLLLLAGTALACGGPPAEPCWRHASKTKQDWHRDYSTCQARAGQAAGHQRDEQGNQMHSEVLRHCLLGEGWYRGKCDARR